MKKKKQEGQYMTPEKIVSMILDAIGYTGDKAKFNASQSEIVAFSFIESSPFPF